MQWTLATIIRSQASARGDRPMITCGPRRLTYGEMYARSCGVAEALADEGVARQDRVAFLDKNGPEYFEVLFGGGLVNAVNVAVNWRLAPREMAYILADADAKVLFVGPEYFPHLEQIESALRAVRKIVTLGDHQRHESYERWVSRRPARDPLVPSAPGDVAMQIYTSGTTGLPKGAMLTNRNLGTLVPSVSPQWHFDATSVNLVAMPLFHIGGSGWALVGMWNGAHSILFREFNPPEVLAAIGHHRITNALFVPAMLQVLSALPGAALGDYATLRSIVYGASPITDDVLIRSMALFKCEFIQVYGLTETTGAITQLDAKDHDPGGPRARLLRSAGRPYPWVEARIVAPESGQDCPRGAVGELWTRSVQNMRGYWNKPEETAQVFAPGGWLKTGDAGFLDEDGYLFLTDRVKDMIISGAENVYPIEVENVLAAHPGIEDVAVIGVPDPKWGETVKAIVVRTKATKATADEIIGFARERLAGYKCPTSIDFVDALPRNPSGKILKRVLREPYWAGHMRRIN